MSILSLFKKKEKIEENKMEEEKPLNYNKDSNNFVNSLKEQVIQNKQSKNIETPIRDGDGQGFNSKISS